MSDKSMLCTGCGHWRSDGAIVDVGDGDGLLWTCPDCVVRLTGVPFGFHETNLAPWEQPYALDAAEPPCDHATPERVQKYDGGKRPLLCGDCYMIVGTW